jgi:hypothetical protein
MRRPPHDAGERDDRHDDAERAAGGRALHPRPQGFGAPGHAETVPNARAAGDVKGCRT